MTFLFISQIFTFLDMYLPTKLKTSYALIITTFIIDNNNSNNNNVLLLQRTILQTLTK